MTLCQQFISDITIDNAVRRMTVFPTSSLKTLLLMDAFGSLHTDAHVRPLRADLHSVSC